MRLLVALGFAGLISLAASAQVLGPERPSLQHVTVDARASAATVPPGGSLMLWADITPKANIHVYAPGAKDFTPVSLVLTPRAGVTPSKPRYPQAELVSTVGVSELVPAYATTFRIVQPVAISRTARTGEGLTIAGAINYQACDDKVCYPSASIPVIWKLSVR